MSDNKIITIKDYMSAPKVIRKMNEMLQTTEAVRQFSTAVISIAGSDELLSVAEPRSLFNACLTAASLNLPINKNLGFAHIIGYKNNRKGGIVEAQFQLIINQGDVREGELIGRDRLTGELKFDWCEDDGDRAELPIIGYFSYFNLKNGFSSTLYMSLEEIQAHGKRYSQSYKKGFGPWVDNFDAMALKTVSKLNISKNGTLSIELQKAIETDQGVIRDDGKADFIDGDELGTVNATDDEQNAILNAQTEEAEVVTPEPAKKAEVVKPVEDKKESVAEKAKRKYGAKEQGSLIED
jgi:recombination protein RecT